MNTYFVSKLFQRAICEIVKRMVVLSPQFYLLYFFEINKEYYTRKKKERIENLLDTDVTGVHNMEVQEVR